MNHSRLEELADALADALPFDVDEIDEVESNCGSVWIKSGGKTYSVSVTECEEEVGDGD